ncbi:MAG: hypothetical protein K2K00_09935 [Muribaculaceae bacterium]|nr:hypothetical protein [Muribaculaceae bacterium]
MKFRLLLVILLLCPKLFVSGKVNIENREFQLVLSDDGLVESLIYKPDCRECLSPGVKIPVCTITQYRPYDNENFLMYPAKPRSFPSNKVWMNGDTLMVEFSDTYDIAKIKVDVTDEYIAFDMVDRDYRIEDYGVKRKTELDEFTLLQLPVTNMSRFGEWLNVMWDDSVAVALVATAPTTFIDGERRSDYTVLSASTMSAVKLYNSGAALIVSHPDSLLDRVASLEENFDMPRGVESRRGEHYLKSYYELRGVTLDNIDRNIELARQAGLKTMVVYYPDFAKTCGHFEWRDEYPGGVDDLKEICRRITSAGMIPGIHIHYSKLAVTDPYICDGTPDRRTNVVSRYSLSKPVTAEDDTIWVVQLPENVRMEDGRRMLHVDDELIMFTDVKKTAPYAFTGCTRGMYNSTPAAHQAMSDLRHLDVDDWPLFIRVDQDTDIQREIAERLAKIYSECGFRFVYFDGAEDVPMPYWYNVSRSQLEVYNALDPKPLFAEGALKSHYGWHILSRGNAFDIFPPERIRKAMRRYTLRCAGQVACDFTSVNFGWVNYLAPSEKTIGMQPDMFDFICSKALAWDSPISLVANLPEIERHPRTEDNFQAISLWENLKLSKSLPTEQKLAMRDPMREFTVIPRPEASPMIVEMTQLTPDSLNISDPIRAFAFRKDDTTTGIIYWDCSGESEIILPETEVDITLETFAGDPVEIKRTPNGDLILPASERRILTIPLPYTEAVSLFSQRVNSKF